jgi:prepilin-type N-terminal cleavage/methylation domain-containing protein
MQIPRREGDAVRTPDADEGFTLVELMVVVFIIGALVAIAIPVFVDSSANARAKSCLANQRALNGAVQTALASGASTAAIVASNVDTATTNGWGHFLIPSLVRSMPRCPAAQSNNLYHMGLDGLVDGDQSGATFSSGSHRLP